MSLKTTTTGREFHSMKKEKKRDGEGKRKKGGGGGGEEGTVEGTDVGGLVTALFVELAQSEIMCDQNQCNKETRSI